MLKHHNWCYESQGQSFYLQAENALSTYMPDALVIVYSVVDTDSFQKAEEILQYLWRTGSATDKAVILVGNKSDLVRTRTVSIVGKSTFYPLTPAFQSLWENSIWDLRLLSVSKNLEGQNTFAPFEFPAIFPHFRWCCQKLPITWTPQNMGSRPNILAVYFETHRSLTAPSTDRSCGGKFKFVIFRWQKCGQLLWLQVHWNLRRFESQCRRTPGWNPEANPIKISREKLRQLQTEITVTRWKPTAKHWQSTQICWHTRQRHLGQNATWRFKVKILWRFVCSLMRQMTLP